MLARIHTTLMTRNDDRGASAVEYGLLVAGIAVVIIAAVFTLGGIISGNFTDVGTQLQNAG